MYRRLSEPPIVSMIAYESNIERSYSIHDEDHASLKTKIQSPRNLLSLEVEELA